VIKEIKKTAKKSDTRLLRKVQNSFKDNFSPPTSLTEQARLLGVHPSYLRRVLKGEKKGESAEKWKEKIVRLSKGLPIEEPKTETTGELV